ncbi:MAG: SDR family oxidoreductase [Armatimonadota bacterium]
MSNKKEWALILGASSGFGEATALELAGRGMNIIGVHLDRRNTMDNVERIINEIKSKGVEALFFNINAADEEKRNEVLAELKEKLSNEGSTIKAMVHSLAFGSLKPFWSDTEDIITPAQMAMTMDVMASSLVYWVQGLMANGLMTKGGRIFAMTSAGSEKVWSHYGAVSAAKAALESNCRQLAFELAPLGITVNAMMAGVTDTPALRKIPGNEKMIETALTGNPSGRLTTPEDVAKAISLFCDDRADFITGNTIRVDGGEFITD